MNLLSQQSEEAGRFPGNLFQLADCVPEEGAPADQASLTLKPVDRLWHRSSMYLTVCFSSPVSRHQRQSFGDACFPGDIASTACCRPRFDGQPPSPFFPEIRFRSEPYQVKEVTHRSSLFFSSSGVNGFTR